MSDTIKLREFLGSIKQFIADLEPTDPYVAVQGFETIWKCLVKETILELDTGDGYAMTGIVAVPLYDIISLSGWHAFKAKHPNIPDATLYYMYLDENPIFKTDFDLETFCSTFNDFYSEFLNDAGFVDGQVEVKGNSIRLVRDSENESKEDEPVDVDAEDVVVEALPLDALDTVDEQTDKSQE
jgi:hypothetical protein